ncbi:MAG: Signal peptidase I [Candidatus Daviesbacteria bacterium GW2011_GWA1_38_7]|nr:MAG: Signal peptidase I [Candidatus Daviesbacteria bacterium GW2011_GWA1_38_7]
MDPEYTVQSSEDIYTTPEETKPSFFSRFRDGLVELIEFVAIVGAVLIVLRFFIAEPHRVSGNSMIPNFHDGDYIITNKVSLRFSIPQRGEVIILKNPRNTGQVFIKRVIALPQDRIKIFQGLVYINGQPVTEPYLPQELKTQGGAFLSDDEEIVVPAGQYFVMGDNRNGSSDSREWGPVKTDLIIGQAWARYWPIPKFGIINIDKPS